jgi:hypothetical protein
MISQSLSLPMTTPTVPIGVACLRRGMVLPFSGKQTLTRERPILPSPLNAPGERDVGLWSPDASVRPRVTENHRP